MGCVGLHNQYFADGNLSPQNFASAIEHAKHNLLKIKNEFIAASWQHCIGSSGTIKLVCDVVGAIYRKDHIDINTLLSLKTRLIEFTKIDNIDFANLRQDRKPILAGGFAILLAIFEVFFIQKMQLSRGAVREGMLYELIVKSLDGK